MGRVAVVALGALLAALLGCSERPAPPRPQPDAATVEAPACTRDPDCVGEWSPQMPRCGPVERCVEGRCRAPAAMTGEASAETGQLVFETPAGERRYGVEIVDERYEITRGLMCRPSMKPDWGMLFFMETTRVQSFWMHNTLIGLDMVFIGEDWTVAGVVPRAEPLTRSARTIGVPSRYVLELVAGEAARAGIVAGVRARFYPPRAVE